MIGRARRIRAVSISGLRNVIDSIIAQIYTK